jgi:hypothetical protein
MNRYPDKDVARIDQQLLETASERSERIARCVAAIGNERATVRERIAELENSLTKLGECIKQDREKVAAFMLRLGFATGHGDTIDDLLIELDGQLIEWMDSVKASEREALAHDFERMGGMLWTKEIARIIRSRRSWAIQHAGHPNSKIIEDSGMAKAKSDLLTKKE